VFFILNIFDGLIWFLLPVSLIIWNDITAYFSGVMFGRKIIKKEFLALSPNKTWEGFIGAGFCTIIFAWFFSKFLSQYTWMICPKADVSVQNLDCVINPVFIAKDYNIPGLVVGILQNLNINITTVRIVPIQLHSLWLALFASSIAPFGGFFTSGMKRAFGIKDFDNLIPGHGGMTDRMDCQMVMGLAIYVHLRTFIYPSSITVDHLISSIYQLSKREQLDLFHQLADRLQQV